MIVIREVALEDLTAVGILGVSAGPSGTIDTYANGSVNPRGLVAATAGLDEVAA